MSAEALGPPCCGQQVEQGVEAVLNDYGAYLQTGCWPARLRKAPPQIGPSKGPYDRLLRIVKWLV